MLLSEEDTNQKYNETFGKGPSKEDNLSIKGQSVHTVPNTPLYLQEEDNLSIVDNNGWSLCVLYSEVPLHIRKRTTSL